MALYDEIIFPSAPNSDESLVLLEKICSPPPCESYPQLNGPLILYGAGKLGKLACDYLQKVGQTFLYIVDRNADTARQQEFWKDVQILNPEEVPPMDKKNAILAICISTFSWNNVVRPLQKQGWEKIIPFYDLTHQFKDQHPLNNGWFGHRFSEQDRQVHASLLGAWQDNHSRASHLQFLAWRMLREEWSFHKAEVDTSSRYFIPEVTKALTGSECFLDVGAHHGEIIPQFLDRVAGKFMKIMAIEADPENMIKLQKTLLQSLPSYSRKKIQFKEIAIGRKKHKGSFISGLNYASQLGKGGMNVQVTTLDSLEFCPTFIKVHLEGGELDALKGGLTKLQQNRPIIAATVYHGEHHMKDLATWLMSHVTNYHFYLRLHGWWGTGLVVYALPKERTNV